MKKPIALIFLFAILSILSFDLISDEKIEDYFLDPNKGKTNYREFVNIDSLSSSIIFKQIISQDESKSDEIVMEYLFMNQDSILTHGGTERILNNKIVVLNQFIFVDNQKIYAEKIEKNIWDPFDKTTQPISMEFHLKDKNLIIQMDALSNSRVIDTLGQQSLIVELQSNIKFIVNELDYSNISSSSKRWYVKNKGLVYLTEFSDGRLNEYYLKE
jgi:hypothetical protein